jgi:hypothetical protein
MGMPVLAEVVETKELVQTVVYAFVAGVGVTVIFSVAIWGVGRSVDLNQEDRSVAAAAAAGVAALALVAVVAAVVIGVIVMTGK